MEFRLDILSVITVLLVVAKIYGYIDLPWVWVFCPLWVPFALFCAFMIIFLLIMVVIAIFDFITNLFY